MSNLGTVQEIYAAFGRGDAPGILRHLSDSIEWEYGAGPSEVPWLQPRGGLDGAAAFFASLSGMQIHKFVPKQFLEASDTVVALIDIDFTVTATGKRVVEEDEVHIWHFDAAGKAVRFRHRVDTQRQIDACR